MSLPYEAKKCSISDYSLTKCLEGLKNPPDVLHYKGDIAKCVVPLVAVIGSRRMTRYGKSCLDKVLPELARYNVGILSGFSSGVDTYAHQLSLKLGMSAVAVLPWGLDYSHSTAGLEQLILASGGCILSEYSGDTSPKKWFFVRRNLLVAAMAIAILVIEAADKSGSLITARYGFKLGKPVYAVPGDIFREQSIGTHLLLQEGGLVCTSGADIASALKLSEVPKTEKSLRCDDRNPPMSHDSTSNFLLTVLKEEPCALEILAERTHLSVSKIITGLCLLQLEGSVVERNGVYYAN